jgi:putative nucleotidyltransferase with HDIG domain
VPPPVVSERVYLDRLAAEVKSIVGDEASHGMRHALNTMDLAERIGRAEGGDLFVIRAAALLHDIGRVNIFSDPEHGRRGAVRAREILRRLDVPADHGLICLIIERHDDPGDDGEGPIELAVVRDADRLELLRIAPGYLDLDRLVTREALRQVPYALGLHYGGEMENPDVTAVIRRAREVLEGRPVS